MAAEQTQTPGQLLLNANVHIFSYLSVSEMCSSLGFAPTGQLWPPVAEAEWQGQFLMSFATCWPLWTPASPLGSAGGLGRLGACALGAPLPGAGAGGAVLLPRNSPGSCTTRLAMPRLTERPRGERGLPAVGITRATATRWPRTGIHTFQPNRKTGGRGRGLMVWALFSKLPFIKHQPHAESWAKYSGVLPMSPHCSLQGGTHFTPTAQMRN